MTKSTVIRPFRVADTEAILELTIQGFSRESSIDALIEEAIGGNDWRKTKQEAVRRELESLPQGVAVAERDGEVVGYISTTINKLAARGVIANLVVSPKCQGEGIGRRLIAWGIAYFRELGLQQAKIETLASNAVGCHLYPAMGFAEVARQVHFVMQL